MNREQILEAVRTTFASEPRFGSQRHVNMDFADGDLTLTGEVPDIAVKKLLLERAVAVPGVDGIVDRLHVTPAESMGDKQIRDLVVDALVQEPALTSVAIYERDDGDWLPVREPPAGGLGDIRVRVDDGVVTLDGEVPTLAHKRLAGVLAWWVPGSRDVVNGLGVLAEETWLDAETTDAVRMVLEKDPFVNAAQVRVFTRDSVVELDGLVPTDSERDMAEFDAWFVYGVDKVVNRIEVRPVPAHGGE